MIAIYVIMDRICIMGYVCLYALMDIMEVVADVRDVRLDVLCVLGLITVVNVDLIIHCWRI